MSVSTRILGLVLLAFLAACTPRGVLVVVPGEAAVGTRHSVFVATTRAVETGAGQFGAGRVAAPVYARYDVSVPPLHVTGEIEWPRRDPNPTEHFLTVGLDTFAKPQGFRQELSRAISTQSGGRRGAVVYVHGFNNNFAEGLYRLVQFSHDFEMPGVAVHYSWPSAANPLGYAYDRDSVIAARDGFEALLRQVADAGATEILIVAHSVGGYLTMETLRQLAIARDRQVMSRISGVVLMSPDIDIDVFRSQAVRIGKLPQPFVIFSSQKDRALRLSARLTGQRGRLGNVTTAAELADLEVTLVDVTQFADGSGLNHSTATTSPALIALFRGMPALNDAFNNDASARTGLLPGTILTVQNATEIILNPGIR